MPAETKLAPERPLSPSAAKLRLLKKLRCTLRFEKKARECGAHLVAGVDEVGRGSLFGPVVAAAVILDATYRIRGLRDSKLLLPERREQLAERIRAHAIAIAVAAVDAARIDQINIYHASRLAMREAVSRLSPAPDYLLIDALRLDCEHPQRSIIHGDALSASIAAASIIAKVERDRLVRDSARASSKLSGTFSQFVNSIQNTKFFRSVLQKIAGFDKRRTRRKSSASCWRRLRK